MQMNMHTHSIFRTADDFGASMRANDTILTLLHEQKVDRVSVMMRPTLTPDVITKLIESSVKIDIHLFIPQLHNVLKLHDNTLQRGMRFLYYILNGTLTKKKISVEWDRQIKAFITTFGYPPNGLNSHEHTHLFPTFFHIACQLAEKHNISFIRCGTKGTRPRTTAISIILSIFHGFNRRTLSKYPSLTTTRYLTSIDWLKNTQFSHMPKNTEILFHPERPEEYDIVMKYL